MHFLSWSNPAKLSRSRFHILEFKSSLGSSRNIPPAPALPIKIPVLPFPPGLGKRGQQIPGRSRPDSPIFHRILRDLPFCELPGREAKKNSRGEIPGKGGRGEEDTEPELLAGFVRFFLFAIKDSPRIWRPNSGMVSK